MWPDRVSNPGPLIYESGALPTALRGPPKDVLRQSTCMVVNPIMVNNFAVPCTCNCMPVGRGSGSMIAST